MLILVPPCHEPTSTGWRFVIGRRTREGTALAIVYPPTPAPAPTTGGQAA